MTKTQEVMSLLSEDKSTEEIIEQTKCSKGLVSQCRKKLDSKKVEEEEDDLATEEEINEAYNNVVNRVQIKPDPATLTNNNTKKNSTFDVECGSCGHEWQVNKSDHISNCPACGVGLL